MVEQKSEDEIEAEIEELEENMNPLLPVFFFGSAAFFAYGAMALIGVAPGFPGLMFALIALAVIQLALHLLHPDLKRKRELHKELNS